MNDPISVFFAYAYKYPVFVHTLKRHPVHAEHLIIHFFDSSKFT